MTTIHFVICYFHLEVVEVVVVNDCQDILANEMEAIQVEFKFYEEYNKLAEKTETKWTSLGGNFISFISAYMYFAKCCKSCHVVSFFSLSYCSNDY